MRIGFKSRNSVESGPDEKGRLFSLTYYRRVFSCRLCTRVGLIVLATIILVEAAILYPSLRSHERDLLRQIDAQTISAIAASVATGGLHPGLAAFDETILRDTPLRGGAFYGADDRLLGTFGEAPTLSIEQVRQRSALSRRSDDGTRYELLWHGMENGLPYSIVARADSSQLDGELRAFVLRIGGLVLLISSFVTTVTILILGKIVLDPLLRLREKLNAASADPEHPERYVVTTRRQDEFGDVVVRFNGLLQLISSTHRDAIARVVSMTDNSLDGIVACNADGRFVYANQAALDFLGASDLGALQRVAWRLERPESGETMSLVESLSKGAYSHELLICLPEGTKRPVLCSANMLTDQDGRATLYYASFHDIAERKRAEEAARNSERQITLIADGVPAFIAAVDRDLRYRFVNQAFERLFGRPRAEIVGRTMSDLLGEDLAPIQPYIDRALRGETVKFERIMRNTAIGNRHVRATFVPSQDDNGSNNGFYVMSQDITDTKRAEEALRESEERFRKIFQRSNDAILLLDPHSAAILDANDAALGLLGYTRDELLLTSMWDIHPHETDACRAFIAKVIAEGGGRRDDLTCQTKVGHRIPADISAAMVELGGRPMVLAHVRDLAQRKKVEQALRTAKIEADLANRAKSEFLANMSHELRTPLNAILGFSEIIAKESFGTVGSPQYKEYACDIHDSGAHLLGIINDILDLSKIEAGRYELHEVPIDLDELIQSCLRMMASQFSSAGLTVETRLRSDLPKLLADERACKQILINLLSNSRKFTPAGGHITVLVELDEASRMCLSVRDTGVGIPPDHLDRVLKPFTQVDSSLARRHEGTGLGLSLVSSFVDIHGGTVEIESEVGAGTTVTVRFPASRLLTREEDGVLRQAI